MVAPILVAGTFEPGATVGGKTVESWGVWNTTLRFVFGDCHQDVVVRFTDGTTLYATSVRRVRR
jgi:hypothetical protein